MSIVQLFKLSPMGNFGTLQQIFLTNKSGQWSSCFRRAMTKAAITSSISVLLSLGLGTVSVAADAASAPPELREAISEIEAAANDRDLERIEQFYSSSFTNSDELNRQELMATLKKLWEQYPRLNYRTELVSWEREGEAIVAETITYVNGSVMRDGRMVRIESILRSRQRFQNEEIVAQEILAETTKVTAGNNPPQVTLNLPEQVRLGEPFNFDAIVTEPLADDLLMGTAIEEQVSSDRYLEPTELELDLLPAGGIFKVGRITDKPGDRWVSAILIRGDGMTIVSQRLHVVGNTAARDLPQR
ncbi:MAG: nuclear transport factor 2 family protein [Oscillatoria sp. PMC 1051.18]|nr:nuclear transport factor 2 family protein [Oscillatoria sp. PMC 1051.18]